MTTLQEVTEKYKHVVSTTNFLAKFKLLFIPSTVSKVCIIAWYQIWVYCIVSDATVVLNKMQLHYTVQ